jgi:hypothetical protein
MKPLTDTDCTYFLCPDKRCKLFIKPDCHIPCDHDCPHPKRMKKAIVCWSCHEVIALPADHSAFCRVDCTCGAANFQRMSGRYRRVNV